MGGTESKSHPPTANPQTHQDKQTDEDTNHTPLSNRRIMKLRDPRSPTDGVQRTPIIVPKPDDDSFEDPRSPTVKIARTPIPDTDPRSPTEGITRTPCPFTYPDPRSPTVNIARTPVHKGSESDCSGKFEMPSVDQSDTIEENEEEVQNVSNNNSSDTAKLIDHSLTNDEPEHSSLASAPQKPSSENGVNSQTETELSKAVEEPSVTHDAEEEDGQKTNLLASDKGSSKKSRKTSLKLSLMAKINGSHSAPPRSPLSTRNLDKDVPSVHVHTGDGVITYNKAGSRRRQASGTPTRLVGKYEPMIDKENL